VVDIMERAAFLEFCEGLNREYADLRALNDCGFASWSELHLASKGARYN
jgi:hypothetical protein